MAKASGSGAPASVAEGLGNVLRAVSDTMAAPDAAQMKVPLMHLQATVLDLVHGQMKGQQQGGQQQPGGSPPPPGGGPTPSPPGGGGLTGGLTGMMGQPQGPSKAVSGGGPSLSGMDPEEMRSAALVGADGGDQ